MLTLKGNYYVFGGFTIYGADKNKFNTIKNYADTR
jgi:hypothetical protein